MLKIIFTSLNCLVCVYKTLVHPLSLVSFYAWMIYKSVLNHFKLIKEQKIKLKKRFKKSKELLVKSTLNISEAEIQTGVFNSFFLQV